MRHGALSTLDKLARGVDVYRVVPRIALACYMVQAWRVGEWAMGLKDISTPQTVFISTVYGVFPLLLNFYMQQGNNWMPPGFSQPQTTVTATATTPAPLAKGN
jgi:hypothetical protein